MKKLIPVIIAAVMLIGCSGGTSEINEKPFPDVKEEVKDYSFSQYDNLTFDCSPQQIEADEVYIITTGSSDSKSADESTKQELKKYIDLLYDTNVNTANMEYSFDFTQQELEENKIDSSIERFNISVDLSDNPGGSLIPSNNTFVASDYHEYEYGGDKGFKTGTLYLPDELPEKSFHMFDSSSMTLHEAVSQAEKYIEKIQPLFNENSSYKLKRVFVEDYPDKGAVIDLRFEHCFYGLSVNDEGFDLMRDGEQFVHAPFIEVKLLGKNYLGRINNSHYDVIEQKEKVEKLISLKDAQRLASENIAPNVTGTVTEVSLEYVCVTKQEEKVHTYRPMWCFTLDNYPPRLDSMELFPRRMIFVDAVSGTTYYSDHRSFLFAAQK